MRLKQKPGDFRVTELLKDDVLDDKGKHHVYKITKRKLTSIEAAEILAQMANVPVSDIAMAGLKDRQGVTEQYMSMPGGKRVDLHTPELKIEAVGSMLEPLSAENSYGNGFVVRLRDLTPVERRRLLAHRHVVGRLGVPNYFDEQRFGNLRHGQGWVAKDLMLGRHEKALKSLLCAESEHDAGRLGAFKLALRGAWGDWSDCREVAGRFGEHHSVFDHLQKHPDDFAGAFYHISSRLRLIHLYAFQSHIWNRAVAAYFAQLSGEKGARLGFTVEGPQVFPDRKLDVDEAFGGSFRLPGDGLEDVENETQKGLLTHALKREGMTPEQFRVEGVSGFQLKGEDRRLFIRPRHLKIEEVSSSEVTEGTSRLSFELPRGAYATLVVRGLLSAFSKGKVDLDRMGEGVTRVSYSQPAAGGRSQGDRGGQRGGGYSNGPRDRDQRQSGGWGGKPQGDRGYQGGGNRDHQGASSGGQGGYQRNESRGYQGAQSRGQQGGEQRGYQGGQARGYQGGESRGYQGAQNRGYQGGDNRGQQGGESRGYQGGQNRGYQGGQDRGQQGGESRGYQGGQSRGYQGGQSRGYQGGQDRGQQGGESRGYQGGQDRGQQGGESRGYQGGQSRGYQGGQSRGYQGGQDRGQQGGESRGYQGGQSRGYQGGQSRGYQGGQDRGQQGGESRGYQGGQSRGYQGGQNRGQQGGESRGYQGGQSRGYQGGQDRGQQGGESRGYQGGQSRGYQGGESRGYQGGQSRGYQGGESRGYQGGENRAQQSGAGRDSAGGGAWGKRPESKPEGQNQGAWKRREDHGGRPAWGNSGGSDASSSQGGGGRSAWTPRPGGGDSRSGGYQGRSDNSRQGGGSWGAKPQGERASAWGGSRDGGGQRDSGQSAWGNKERASSSHGNSRGSRPEGNQEQRSRRWEGANVPPPEASKPSPD